MKGNMKAVLLGLFADSKDAGSAVAELKDKGYAKEISVMARNSKTDTDVYEVKQDITEGAAVGATVGVATGLLAGLFSGVSMIAVPGLGLLVGGPLAALMGLAGGVVGSVGGGVIGALIDFGVNEATAEVYDKAIKRNEVLIGVTTEESSVAFVTDIMNKHSANNISIVHKG